MQIIDKAPTLVHIALSKKEMDGYLKRKGPMIVPPPIPKKPPIVLAVTIDLAYIAILLTPQFKSINVSSSFASWCVFDAI